MNKKEKMAIKNNEFAMDASFISTVFKYYKKHKFLALIITFFIVITVFCSIIIPLLTYQMTTSITKEISDQMGKTVEGPIKYWGLNWKTIMFIMLGVTALNAICIYITQYFGVLLGKRIEIDLRNKILEKLVKQDISYYSDKKIGELLTKIVSDTQTVGDQASTAPRMIMVAALQVTASIGMMFAFEWKLASIVMATFLGLLFVMFFSYNTLRKKITLSREIATEINGDITDRINAIRLVKSTGTEKYESKRFESEHAKYLKATNEFSKSQGLMVTLLFSGISFLQFSAIASAIGFHNTDSTFFMTTFTAFNLAFGTMTSPIFQIVMAFIGMAQATVSCERVSQIINSKSIMESHYDDGKIIEDLSGEIIFKDIQFAYPEKPNQLILPKFDFKFESGKSYAFVGETGSGKSTIAKLLLRFYDPTQGEILINGETNLKDVNLASYLKYVGYVEQEPQIIYGNVFDNVKYGIFDATNEQVIEACKKAQLHELIETWKDGYETILGERGFMLSGGQKQRLVIARMFLKDPKVLILDEATSALDNIVEKEIQMKLDELMIGRTSISIAHRLSTIKDVDQIIVLGNGKGIVQMGKFEELKSKPGHFKKLYEAGLME